MFLINLNAEIVACIITPQAKSGSTSKYGFLPIWGKNGGVLNMRMQVILDSFRPPGFSRYWGREERRVQGLDYLRLWLKTLTLTLIILDITKTSFNNCLL